MFEHDFVSFPELSNVQLETLRFVSPHIQIEEDFAALVVKVIDGDTVKLRSDFRSFDFTLRIANIDAKELSAGGDVAKYWLKSLVENQMVQIIINKNNRVGKYGRLIGELLFSGSNVGEDMVGLSLVKPFGFKLEGEIPSLDKIFYEVSV